MQLRGASGELGKVAHVTGDLEEKGGAASATRQRAQERESR